MCTYVAKHQRKFKGKDLIGKKIIVHSSPPEKCFLKSLKIVITVRSAFK